MKTLTINTLGVALALTLWGTSSMAAAMELSGQPVSPAEQRDRPSATAATPTVPLYALTRLDAQSLAAQAMTDQELKAVEGGVVQGFPRLHYDYVDRPVKAVQGDKYTWSDMASDLK